MARRNVRKLTVWHSDEWGQIEEAARAFGMPPLRFVREAALHGAGKKGSLKRRKRRPADELVHQLARILGGLQQLQRFAEERGDDGTARMVARVRRAAEEATAAAPENAREAAPLLEEVRVTGAALDEVISRVRSHDCVPEVAQEVLIAAHLAVRSCLT